IMGGSGHLSNQQSFEAIRRIQPRSGVVLLHLSRECNRPELVAAMHDGAPYGVTISGQGVATEWITVAGSGSTTPSTMIDTTSVAHAPLFAALITRETRLTPALPARGH
ncbi:MAG: hypothetical protein ACT4PL_13310, partial [Phycisphaerales bacterium]